MDNVTIFLVVMAIGSIIAALIVPPYLNKIDRTGHVNFFGIRFPF